MASIFVCGDILNSSGKTGFISDDLSAIIRKADYSIANLEGPELKEGQTFEGPHQCEGTLKYLKESNFNMMLLANNHITELGKEGLKYTTGLVDKYGMDRIGAGLSRNEAYNPVFKKIAESSFVFINVCEAQVGQFVEDDQEYGYAWMGYDGLFDSIHSLSQTSDYVVVFVHTGLEHYPIPLPEVRSFYKKLCDAGAAAVIGGHTHSPQGYEFYGEKFIAYSLGNFFFTRKDGTWEEEKKSYSLVLEFNNKKINVKPIFHRQIGDVVSLAKDNSEFIDLDNLCNYLGNGYNEFANKMCVNAYKKLCEKLLASATIGEYEGIKSVDIIKNIIRCTILRKRFIISTKEARRLLLLRLFENESYRYTIIRALNCLKS